MSSKQGGNVQTVNLGKHCARGYTPDGWGLWEFEPGKETRCRSTVTWKGTLAH